LIYVYSLLQKVYLGSISFKRIFQAESPDKFSPAATPRVIKIIINGCPERAAKN